jgi:hypothetical protein
MGIPYLIPLKIGTPQTVSVVLGPTTYQLTLMYRNDPGGFNCWSLDIADIAGNPIVQGIALVTGADLLAQYRHLGFTGSLVVATTSDPDAIPTFENLGSDGQLYWVPDGS